MIEDETKSIRKACQGLRVEMILFKQYFILQRRFVEFHILFLFHSLHSHFSWFNAAEVMGLLPPTLYIVHIYLDVFHVKFMVSLLPCVSSSHDRRKSQMSLKCSTKKRMKNVMCFLMFNVAKFYNVFLCPNSFTRECERDKTFAQIALIIGNVRSWVTVIRPNRCHKTKKHTRNTIMNLNFFCRSFVHITVRHKFTRAFFLWVSTGAKTDATSNIKFHFDATARRVSFISIWSNLLNFAYKFGETNFFSSSLSKCFSTSELSKEFFVSRFILSESVARGKKLP